MLENYNMMNWKFKKKKTLRKTQSDGGFDE